MSTKLFQKLPFKQAMPPISFAVTVFSEGQKLSEYQSKRDKISLTCAIIVISWTDSKINLSYGIQTWHDAGRLDHTALASGNKPSVWIMYPMSQFWIWLFLGLSRIVLFVCFVVVVFVVVVVVVVVWCVCGGGGGGGVKYLLKRQPSKCHLILSPFLIHILVHDLNNGYPHVALRPLYNRPVGSSRCLSESRGSIFKFSFLLSHILCNTKKA